MGLYHDMMRAVEREGATLEVMTRNGRFMFNSNTLWALVRIKDSTGRYI